jgi:thiol-disulfide isomerase/thioredoxin
MTKVLRYKSARWLLAFVIQTVALALLALAGHAKPASKAPTVQTVNVAGLKQAIAARKGQVVLVNFWATWCLPCKEEFPALLKLRQKYAPGGLSILFVSADDAGARNAAVLPFLKIQKVNFPTFLVSGNPGSFIEKFDPDLEGAFALPRTYLYNRNGKLSKAFSGDKDFAEWEKIVKPLF